MEKENYEYIIGMINVAIEYNSYLVDEFVFDPLTYKRKYDEIDYRRLQLAQTAMLLSMYKDKTMDKYKVNRQAHFEAKVTDEFLENSALMVSRKINGKYYIGSFEYSSNLEVIDTLRNKLAHGDYILEGDYIKFAKTEIKSNPSVFEKVSLKDLRCMAINICNADLFITNGIGQRTLYIIEPHVIGKPISNYDSFVKALDHIYCVNFFDQTSNGDKKDESYIIRYQAFLQSFRMNIANVLESFPTRGVNQNINAVVNVCNREVFRNENTKITAKVTKLSKSTIAKEMYKTYKVYEENFSEEIKNDYDIQIQIIQKIAYNYLHANAVLERMKCGYLNNILQLENSIRGEDKNIFLDFSPTSLDDTSAMSFLTMFYSIYQMGLENMYSHSDKTTLEEIFNEDCLDFSLLDLACLDDPNMDIICKFSSMKDQKKSILNDINKQCNNVSKLETNYNKYIKGNSIDEKVKDKLYYNLLVEKTKYNLGLEADTFLNTIDKYERNYNILLNIRDSIAHGNYSLINNFEKGKDSLYDMVLVFDNTYDGVTHYHKEIKLRDFIKIFSVENLKIINDFFENKLNKGLTK